MAFMLSTATLIFACPDLTFSWEAVLQFLAHLAEVRGGLQFKNVALASGESLAKSSVTLMATSLVQGKKTGPDLALVVQGGAGGECRHFGCIEPLDRVIHKCATNYPQVASLFHKVHCRRHSKTGL